MAEAQEDVKETTPVADVQPQAENSAPVSDEGTKVDRKVYEKVREDMLSYKAEKKAKDAELEAIKAEIEELKAAKESVEDYEPVTDEDTRTKAKVDILYLVQTDEFVKENLDLIEEKMAKNPHLTAEQAVEKIQADFFRRMQKEVAKADPEVPPKSINPQGNSTAPKVDVIKEALEGRDENADPRQLEAYKATLARLPK